ncbi:MAG: response regulator, partial [bacterium]|nr:response regulator [bacterium]
MGSGRILIVDDDRLFRTYACDILKPEGYQVWTAATGEEAFRVLKQDRFDVIIVDVVMENLSGLDLVRRIREADPEQEIVMVTGLEDVRTAVEAMKLGVSDYVLKPIDPHGFLFLIDKLLARRTLALENNSLVLENLEYFETLSVYDRGMKFLEILDPDRLAEIIIDSTLNLTNGQGGILWLRSQADPQ